MILTRQFYAQLSKVNGLNVYIFSFKRIMSKVLLSTMTFERNFPMSVHLDVTNTKESGPKMVDVRSGQTPYSKLQKLGK